MLEWANSEPWMWAWVVAELVSQGQLSIAGAGLGASPPRALEGWGQLSHADVFGASSPWVQLSRWGWQGEACQILN